MKSTNGDKGANLMKYKSRNIAHIKKANKNKNKN